MICNRIVAAVPKLVFVAWALVFCWYAIAQDVPRPSVQHTILHSFGGPDGAGPSYGVIAGSKGVFYGSTIFGGNGGLVFKLIPGKSGYKETVITTLNGTTDGDHPQGIVADAHGALYGGTLTGGNNTCAFGCGTVFKLTPHGSGFRKNIIYRFGGGSDAQQVVGIVVVDRKGAVYGATQFGGTFNNGAVFKLTPAKSGYTESVLYSFPGGSGGSLPQAGLAIDSQGTLYGTTYYGGAGSCGAGCGTIFRIRRVKIGYKEDILYSFQGGADGAQPYAALSIDPNTGDIYGTTEYGGTKGIGTAFKLTRKGSGYVESILHSFDCGGYGNPTACLPIAPLLLMPDGSLYGSLSLGGGGCSGIGCGAIFKLTPGNSGYSYDEIYDFRPPRNGADPESTALITDGAGNLYGATRSGGTKTNCYDGGPGGAHGCGTVFKLTVH